MVVRPGEAADLAAALGRAFTARYPAGPARYLVSDRLHPGGTQVAGLSLLLASSASPTAEKSFAITRPVVFVHGIRTSSAIWSSQVAALTEHGHHSVTVDLPGHGARTADRFTLDGAFQAIDDAVVGCAVPPLLVGLSLGGYASLAYAARNEDKLAGVMLAGCSTEIRGKPLGAYRRLAQHVNEVVRSDGGTWHVVTDMLAAMKGYSSMADLRRLRVPVWLVNGKRDLLRLDERRFLGAKPGTRLSVVPRAGHDVNSHAPIVFNRILLDALHELRLPELHLPELHLPELRLPHLLVPHPA